MTDRRVHPRIRTDRIRALIRPGQTVIVIDVSPRGALVEARTQLRPGSLVEVQLEDEERRTSVGARVVRCDVTGISPDRGTTYRAGLAFIEHCAWLSELETQGGSDIPAPGSAG
jgi:hypothetical protein